MSVLVVPRMFGQSMGRLWRKGGCVVLLLLLWQGAVLAAERRDFGRTLKELGYEMVELRRTGDNHLFLFGKVEGRRRSCLVDTGWSYSSISTNTGARLTGSNLIRRLELGRVVLTNESVRVQDMRVNGQPTSYDVVLGCDFLLRHHAVIDFVGLRLYLRRNELSAVEQAQVARVMVEAGLAEVGMKQRDPLALTCVAQVNERAVEMLVDSGATWSCFDTKVAEAVGLKAVPTLNRIAGPASARRRNFAVADLKSWQLGGRQMRQTSVAVFDLVEWGLGPDGKLFSDVGGILGGAELFASQAVIDYGRLTLWLRVRR